MTTIAMRIPKAVYDVAERAGWTFVQVFLGFLVANEALSNDVAALAATAGFAAALAVVKGAITEWLRKHDITEPPSSLAGDIALRVFFTYAQAVLAIVIVAPTTLGTWSAALTAAVPAALAALKGAIAARVGRISPATLPAELDRTPVYIP